MQRYQRLGMQLRLKRVESGLHQKTLGILIGGATQALISWWESGRYLPGDRYLGRINHFLGLDPLALRVYVRASGLQQRRRHGHKIKTSHEALKMDQRTPFMSGQGPVPNPPAQSSLLDWEVANGNMPPPHLLRDMVMVALTTGMRRGEILGLKWDYIKLDNRLIILPVTKNNTVRVLPINDTLHRILSEMPQKSGYVFGNGNGGHIENIKHSFTSACRKAGITDFRFHDLRHTYASHLAMRGVHIRALQELLGHKTLAMTQRYSHLAPEQLQSAVKLLDGVIGERQSLVE